METALSLLLAVLPVLVAAAWVLRKDRRRPEPGGQLLRIFLLGVLLVLPAAVVELALFAIGDQVLASGSLQPLYKAFVVAALVEEGLKYVLLRRTVLRKKHFDETTDGLVYAVMAGMGFACLENVLFVLGNGLAVAVMRGFTSIPMHASASVFMGYWLGMARFAPTPGRAARLAARGFLLAVLLHGLYDAFLFGIPVWGPLSGLGIVPLLVASLILVKRMVRRAIRADIEAGRRPAS